MSGLYLLVGLALGAEGLGTTGELRLLASLPPDPVLDTDGNSMGQGAVLDSRIRAGASWTRSAWKVGLELDALDGQLVGDTWDIAGDEDARRRQSLDAFSLDGLSLRRAAVEGRLGDVGVQAGLVTSHWGLGMVANDGAHDPVFGRTDFGDRVLRLRLATKPLDGGEGPLTVMLAGDRVVEDDTASWSPMEGGQAAWQGIGALLWAEEGQQYGLYSVYRHQTEQDGERVTRATVVDLYADRHLPVGEWTLRLAGELAIIGGDTTRSQSYTSREGLDLRSQGFTGLVELRPSEAPSFAMLRVGWASGDGNPDDGVSRDFAFDRDFDVGMVLYDELLGAVEAQTFNQLNDPGNAAQPPEGAETLVSEGAFRRAAFLQPVVGGNFLPWIHLRLGAALSWATAPPGQAFESYRAGGTPSNHLGQPTSGYGLGTELNWALHLGDVELAELLRPALVLQGGHLLANENVGGGTLSLVTATGRLRW